ncbi:MAG: hypothetical protein MHM6MM_003411 [Cercozoa sp. M6MM]
MRFRILIGNPKFVPREGVVECETPRENSNTKGDCNGDDAGLLASENTREFVDSDDEWEYDVLRTFRLRDRARKNGEFAIVAIADISTEVSLPEIAAKFDVPRGAVSDLLVAAQEEENVYCVLLRFHRHEEADEFIRVNKDVGKVMKVSSFESDFEWKRSQDDPCPICLEPISWPEEEQCEDEGDLAGWLYAAQVCAATVQCKHTFHWRCVLQWQREHSLTGDACCPLCRCSLIPTTLNENVTRCAECTLTEELWMCLVCGHVGCGRRQNAHARKHYESTFHAYASHVSDGRVWDYASDDFTERVVLAINADDNNGGAKLVATADASNADKGKLTQVADEFQALLTRELDEQRRFYERRLQQLATEDADIDELRKQQSQVEQRVAHLQEVLQGLRNEVARLKQEAQKLQKHNAELIDEKQEFECLQTNVREGFAAKIRENSTKISNLREEIHDLECHANLQQQLQHHDGSSGDYLAHFAQQRTVSTRERLRQRLAQRRAGQVPSGSDASIEHSGGPRDASASATDTELSKPRKTRNKRKKRNKRRK